MTSATWRISDVIRRLTELQEKHGDVPCYLMQLAYLETDPEIYHEPIAVEDAGTEDQCMPIWYETNLTNRDGGTYPEGVVF